MELSSRLSNLRKKVDRAVASKDHLEKFLLDNIQSKNKEEAHLQGALRAREMIIALAKNIQEDVETRLSEIVTLGMSVVFDNPYSFKIQFVQRRNTVEADLIFTKDGNEYDDILESSGGGASDIASFCLRIGLWSLRKTQSVFILDEPFRNLSPNLHDKASEMCKMLCDKLGIQIIMVSHSKDILNYADKVFTIANGQIVKEN